jgi:hypothetical protein
MPSKRCGEQNSLSGRLKKMSKEEELTSSRHLNHQPGEPKGLEIRTGKTTRFGHGILKPSKGRSEEEKTRRNNHLKEMVVVVPVSHSERDI